MDGGMRGWEGGGMVGGWMDGCAGGGIGGGWSEDESNRTESSNRTMVEVTEQWSK